MQGWIKLKPKRSKIMIVYKIENMETHEVVYVQAASSQEMVGILKKKGFNEIPGKSLATHNKKCEEISAMAADFAHVSYLKAF